MDLDRVSTDRSPAAEPLQSQHAGTVMWTGSSSLRGGATFEALLTRKQHMDLGTRLSTYLNGRQIGADTVGNRYFTERRPSPRRARIRRWIIYLGIADPSSVP